HITIVLLDLFFICCFDSWYFNIFHFNLSQKYKQAILKMYNCLK
ncbi:unnamed protein product, partial [Brachionus calyciflorus]